MNTGQTNINIYEDGGQKSRSISCWALLCTLLVVIVPLTVMIDARFTGYIINEINISKSYYIRLEPHAFSQDETSAAANYVGGGFQDIAHGFLENINERLTTALQATYILKYETMIMQNRFNEHQEATYVDIIEQEQRSQQPNQSLLWLALYGMV